MPLRQLAPLMTAAGVWVGLNRTGRGLFIVVFQVEEIALLPAGRESEVDYFVSLDLEVAQQTVTLQLIQLDTEPGLEFIDDAIDQLVSHFYGGHDTPPSLTPMAISITSKMRSGSALRANSTRSSAEHAVQSASN